MKLCRKFAISIVVLLLAACATGPVTLPQGAYQAQSDYIAAGKVMLAYGNLPRCGQPTSPIVCSQQSVVDQLKAADNIAYNAVVAAENTARTPGAGANLATAQTAATEAVAALARITATLKTN